MRLRCSVLCAAIWMTGASASFAQTVKVPGNYPTIQSALNAVVSGSAADGTVIEVQPGTYNEALLVDSTARSFTLRGVAGPGSTIVNATASRQSALRIYRATGAMRIEGITFRGGAGVQGTGGGFTLQDASPVLTNVVFEGNTGLDAGGGVIIRSNAHFSDCFIRNNTAARFGGGMVITAGSHVLFSNCQIRDNVSGTGGAGCGKHRKWRGRPHQRRLADIQRVSHHRKPIEVRGRWDSHYRHLRIAVRARSANARRHRSIEQHFEPVWGQRLPC